MAVSIMRLAFPTETLKALLPQIVTSVLRGRDVFGVGTISQWGEEMQTLYD